MKLPVKHQGREGPENEGAVAARRREREGDCGVERGGDGGVGEERGQTADHHGREREAAAPAAET